MLSKLPPVKLVKGKLLSPKPVSSQGKHQVLAKWSELIPAAKQTTLDRDVGIVHCPHHNDRIHDGVQTVLLDTEAAVLDTKLLQHTPKAHTESFIAPNATRLFQHDTVSSNIQPGPPRMPSRTTREETDVASARENRET